MVRTTTDEGLHVERIDRLGRRPARTYLPGRICVMTDCEVSLSRYNRGPMCFAHSRERLVPNVVRRGSW